MTALVYMLLSDQVHVAMDTLVVAAEDKKPMSFQRKFLSNPQCDLLIAGTGSADLITGWFEYVSSLSDLSGIDDLNRLTPSVVQDSVRAAGGLGEITTTLYHFGYSRADATYVGYAYRSTADFQSEKLQYSLGVKPQVHVEFPENIEIPSFFITIILEQQRQDQLRPSAQQLGIGGEIELALLANRETHIETVHRFVTYERERKYIERRENA